MPFLPLSFKIPIQIENIFWRKFALFGEWGGGGRKLKKSRRKVGAETVENVARKGFRGLEIEL